jgi:hypothetical protein
MLIIILLIMSIVTTHFAVPETSGFMFMGGSAAGSHTKSSGGDSFSFVADEMRKK